MRLRFSLLLTLGLTAACSGFPYTLQIYTDPSGGGICSRLVKKSTTMDAGVPDAP